MKGKLFTEADVPKRLKSRPESMRKAWLAAQTARYAIVARDPAASPERRELIAEEVAARTIARLPEKVRRLVPLVLRLSVVDRMALVSAFDPQGALRNPFERV